jgi:hypothetical protein
MNTRTSGWTAAPLAAAGLIGVLLLSCGGDNLPAGSTSATITLPASPTPDSSTNAGCTLGKGSVNASCSSGTGSSRLLRKVESAIDLLVREKPQLVDTTVQSPPNTNQYRVLDVEAYLDGVVENLVRAGLCAERDPDDLGSRRILVKNSNDFSEGFSVLGETGFMRRGSSAFVQSCDPASFPVDRTSDMPPAGSGCGRPYPPPITRFNVYVHGRGPTYYTIDSTPIVGPDKSYCIKVGFVDGRTLCPVRAEGWPDRAACENWRVGRARDTGRFGPTWTNHKDELCTGPASNCSNHPDNQYDVLVYKSGKVTACAENGACGWTMVER